MNREEEIRAMAYKLWEEEGHSEGRDLQHWLRAQAIWQEREGKQAASQPIEGPEQSPRARPTQPSAKTRSPRRKK